MPLGALRNACPLDKAAFPLPTHKRTFQRLIKTPEGRHSGSTIEKPRRIAPPGFSCVGAGPTRAKPVSSDGARAPRWPALG